MSCVIHSLQHRTWLNVTSVSLTHQIEEKIRHQGFDEDGVPCCCVFALSQCDDFKAQKNAVKELIESLGHLCVFLPKYHPELNFIERFWSRLKWWLRQHCEWSLRALFEKIEEACDKIELSLIRKYARTAWRWMDAYRQATRQEWSPQLTTFIAKSYHGHRGVPTSMDAMIDKLACWNKTKAVERAQELVEQDVEMRDAQGKELGLSA